MSKQKTTDLVTTVRSERGYSATNYDASAVKLQKTLRRQIGQKYDAKKVRNSWRLGHLADRLQENNLAAVRILPERYAEAVGHMPFVASITVTPIAKG